MFKNFNLDEDVFAMADRARKNGENLEAFRTLFVPNPFEKEIRVRVLEAVYNGAGDSKIMQSADNIFVVGQPGAGKSRLAAQIKEELEQLFTHKNAIVYAKVPTDPTVKGLNAYINRAMGLDPYYTRGGTVYDQTLDLVDRLIEYQTKLLILDEMQHLFDARFKLSDHVAKHIKQLLNQCVCPIVIIGTSPIISVYKKSGETSRRAPVLFKLEAQDWADPTQQMLYRGFLIRLKRTLKGIEGTELLQSDDFAIRMYMATGGLLGMTADFIRFTLRSVLMQGRSSICMRDFWQQFEDKKAEVKDKKEKMFDYNEFLFEQENPFDPATQAIPRKAEIKPEPKPLRGRKGNRKPRESDVLR